MPKVVRKFYRDGVEYKIKFPVPATSISLNTTSISLKTVGQTFQLIATLQPSSTTDTVSRATSNASVATVSNAGLVTCVTPGECTITASTSRGLTATCNVGQGWEPGTNTIAYYPLESDVLDHSGNNKNGSGNPNTFDTLDSGIKVAGYNGASTTLPYDIITGNSYTLSVRIKNRESSGRLIPIGQHSTSYRDFNIIFENNQWAYSQYNSNLDNKVYGSGTRNVRTHLVCQRTGSTKKLYINGLYCGSNSPRNTSTRTLYMGYDHGYAGGAENCQISQLIVESKIRTAQEISDYYNGTKSNYGL